MSRFTELFIFGALGYIAMAVTMILIRVQNRKD
jgi:hypothetical protein